MGQVCRECQSTGWIGATMRGSCFSYSGAFAIHNAECSTGPGWLEWALYVVRIQNECHMRNASSTPAGLYWTQHLFQYPCHTPFPPPPPEAGPGLCCTYCPLQPVSCGCHVQRGSWTSWSDLCAVQVLDWPEGVEELHAVQVQSGWNVRCVSWAMPAHVGQLRPRASTEAWVMGLCGLHWGCGPYV